MRVDFPKNSCLVLGGLSAYFTNLLARFDDAGQLANSVSIYDFQLPPTTTGHMLAGGADVDGLGGIPYGESTTGIHPSYSVNFNGAFGFNYNQTLPPDPKNNVYVGIDAVAGGPSGDSAAAVWTGSGPADFGGGPMGGGLLRLAANKSYQWMTFVPGVESLKIDDVGNTLVSGEIAIANSAVCGALPAGHFLLVLDPGGSCVYQRSLPQSFQVTVDGAGDAIVAMSFSGTIDLGGGPLTAVGTHDLAIAKYSPAGVHLWSERFGGPGFDPSAISISISANAAGEVALQGSFTGAVDFGAGLVDSAVPCGPDTFFVKLTSPGSVAWARYLHSPGPIAGAIDPEGAVLLVAPSATVDLGSGPVLSTYGMAVAKLAP